MADAVRELLARAPVILAKLGEDRPLAGDAEAGQCNRVLGWRRPALGLRGSLASCALHCDLLVEVGNDAGRGAFASGCAQEDGELEQGAGVFLVDP